MNRLPLALSALVLLSVPAVSRAAPGQNLVLDVNGPQVNPGKVARCQNVARKHGFNLTGDAPIRVTLSLLYGGNKLQVSSVRRGVVLDTPRPGWGMEQLCEDAMQAAERAYAEDGNAPVVGPATGYGGGSPPPAYEGGRPPPAYGYAPPPSAGGTPTIALDVVGPASNGGKVARCMSVAQRRGFIVNPSAAVHVTLQLLPGYNRLQISSARRGPIYDSPKPGWGMEQLCEDAMTQAQIAWSAEGSAPPPQYNQAPPPQYNQAPPPPPPAQKQNGYALGPIPPSKDLPPAAKTSAEAGVAAWQRAQFDAALAAFREAHRVSSDPQFLFDQAVCEQRLNRNADALSHTQQFLDKAPQSPYRPYAEQLFSELQSNMGNP